MFFFFTCVSVVGADDLVVYELDGVEEEVGHEDPVDDGGPQDGQHGETRGQQLCPPT